MQNDTNINKIKPALRTKGSFAGNWGAGRRTGGSQLNDIPANSRESLGNFPTQDEYYSRLISAYNQTDDQRLKGFILDELKKIEAQMPGDRAMTTTHGPHCSIDDHHVGLHQ